MAEQKTRGKSKEIALELLNILEEYTDKDNLLSKREILDQHSFEYGNKGDARLQDKTFYLKIDEIEAAGFPIKRTKGKATRYYLNDVRLTRDELLFLVSMIKTSPDLGEEEADALAGKLLSMRAHKKAKKYVDDYSSVAKEYHNPVSKQILYYSRIAQAIGRAGKISCKYILSRENGYKFSETRIVRPLQILFTRNGIQVTLDDNGIRKYLPLRDIIDIELE